MERERLKKSNKAFTGIFSDQVADIQVNIMLSDDELEDDERPDNVNSMSLKLIQKLGVKQKFIHFCD